MGKRKNEEREDEIRNKIRKLEAELNKKKRPRRIICSSSEDETDDPVITNNTTGNGPRLATMTGTPTSAAPGTATDAAAAAAAASHSTTTSDSAVPAELAEPELDEEILQLLGDAPKTNVQLGPNVHKDIASRWQDILSNGLPKEMKEKLLKEHLIPGNCDLLVPPILNPEVKAALPESLARIDAILAEKQRQIDKDKGIALAALAKATHLLITKEDNSKILKAMSDACRILCDTHYNESKTRRSFAISATNTTLKDTLLETKRDKYLFGDSVSDKLKSAKTIQKSGADLKQNQKNPKFNKANFYKNNKSLNMRVLQRKTSGKPDAGRTPQAPAPATTRPRAPARSFPLRSRSPPRPQYRNVTRRT